MRYLLPLYPVAGADGGVVPVVAGGQGIEAGSWRAGSLDSSARHRARVAKTPLRGSLPALKYSPMPCSPSSPSARSSGAGVSLAIYRRPLTRGHRLAVDVCQHPARQPASASRIGTRACRSASTGEMGYGPGGFYGLESGQGGTMPMAWDDMPEKRDGLYRWLNEADYLIISSNRRWASAPRMPLRFPMTTEYYRRLFAGKLGFKLVYHAPFVHHGLRPSVQRQLGRGGVQRLRSPPGLRLPEDAGIQRGAGAQLPGQD